MSASGFPGSLEELNRAGMTTTARRVDVLRNGSRNATGGTSNNSIESARATVAAGGLLKC
jgi:hypothetical protein